MQPKSKIAAVIFDMDGLMFDTERIAQIAWQRAAADLGYDYTDTLFRGVIGRNLQDVKRITHQALGNEAPFTAIYHRKQAYFDQYIQQNGLPLKAGLLELLEFLDVMRLYKAVASSSPLATIRRNLDVSGLSEDRFSVLMGGDEVKNGKPDPEIFSRAAEKVGIPPAACLVLEDSNAGIQAASAAGMIPVMIPDLLEPSAISQTLAFRILPTLHEVVPLIKDHRLLGEQEP